MVKKYKDTESPKEENPGLIEQGSGSAFLEFS